MEKIPRERRERENVKYESEVVQKGKRRREEEGQTDKSDNEGLKMNQLIN